MLSMRTRVLILTLVFLAVDGYGCPFQKLHSMVTTATTAPSSKALAVATVASSAGASQLELRTVNLLEGMYHDTGKIKCPFFRRRASDILEGFDLIARFLVIRHKSMNLPLGCRVQTGFMEKNKNLNITQIFRIILDDWKITTGKGYYVSGRLNTTIYREDCMFDGPDPDMPVRGLRKFLNAASNLFDYGTSYSELTHLSVESPKLIVAHWRMEGVLRLPWRPVLPEWTGTTYYHLDDDNLIYKHDETWDMSVLEAFSRTLSPELGDRIWNQKSIF